MITVYLIPGLGADAQVFKKLILPIGFTPVVLPWLQPTHEETLPAYAGRMFAGIDTSAAFGLIGLSFGGMLCAEIAKISKPAFTILISSIPSAAQLPPYFRLAQRLGIHKKLPAKFFLRASFLKRIFSIEKNEDKKWLREMIRRADTAFISWALNAILTWPIDNASPPLFLVHGSADLVLPLRYVTPTHLVKGGGHLMIISHAAEVNNILAEILLRPC